MTETDKRAATRHVRAEEMLVKVLSADIDADVDGRIYKCASADVSAGGLRLHSSVPVTQGARLDLRLRAGDVRFVLTGLVRWAQPEGDGCVAGVEVDAAAGDDIEAWTRWVKSL